MSGRYRYSVLWAGSAEADLDDIIGYIAKDDPRVALRMLREIRRRAENLRSLPERGRIVPELHSQGVTSYRELTHRSWRIIYRIDGKTVHVLAVLDARRNIEDLLMDRLLRHA
jgi:toxin ParE1/3/4